MFVAICDEYCGIGRDLTEAFEHLEENANYRYNIDDITFIEGEQIEVERTFKKVSALQKK